MGLPARQWPGTFQSSGSFASRETIRFGLESPKPMTDQEVYPPVSSLASLLGLFCREVEPLDDRAFQTDRTCRQTQLTAEGEW